MPTGVYQRVAPEDSFWSKIVVVESCWHWTATRDRKGYGKIKVHGRDTMAHRYAYELRRGPIPPGLTLDHLCRNRDCVNPDHLEAVTLKENVLRGIGISAMNKRKTHCKRGHEFTPENTYLRGVRRYCRTCMR